MFFKLVDIHGDDQVGGGLSDLEDWLLNHSLIRNSLRESWLNRDDVVALVCQNAVGDIYFSLEPELTRQFLLEIEDLSGYCDPFHGIM